MIQTSHFQSNIIYPYMTEDAIGMEGDFVAGFKRVGVWGSSIGTVIASEVGIIYIFDLGENSFIQSVSAEVDG